MAFSLTRPWILALASFEMAWADPCRSCALSQRRRREQNPSPRLYYGNASRAYPSITELTKIRYPSIIPNSSPQAVLEIPLQPLKTHSPSSTNCYTIQSSLFESKTQTTTRSFPHSTCPKSYSSTPPSILQNQNPCLRLGTTRGNQVLPGRTARAA